MISDFCPKCGSGKVSLHDTSEMDISQGTASCMECSWEGKRTELLSGAVEGEGILRHPDDALEVVRAVAKQYFQALAENAGGPIGKALVKAGIVGIQDTKTLARLIKAACVGAHIATLNELEDIQKEAQNDDGA